MSPHLPKSFRRRCRSRVGLGIVSISPEPAPEVTVNGPGKGFTEALTYFVAEQITVISVSACASAFD